MSLFYLLDEIGRFGFWRGYETHKEEVTADADEASKLEETEALT